MSDKLKKLLEMISGNKELTEKACSMGKEEIIKLAKEMGIELNDEDLIKPASEELSDDELCAVSGGGDVNCVCPLGGGGTKDDDDKACACVLAGAGFTDEGAERCVCGFAGYGYDT